jgi:small subunit ribosomal protein S11
MAQAKRKDKAKKRVVVVDNHGQVHVKATFNNIMISVTNAQGQVIAWASAGKMGFRGSKKNTPYAAQQAAMDCAKVAYDLGLRKVKVYVKGPGSGRESAIRNIHASGIEVTEIVDVTPLPHNGCRPAKRRRV